MNPLIDQRIQLNHDIANFLGFQLTDRVKNWGCTDSYAMRYVNNIQYGQLYLHLLRWNPNKSDFEKIWSFNLRSMELAKTSKIKTKLSEDLLAQLKKLYKG